MYPKRILVLHDLSVGSRRTNRDHIYSFAKYAPQNIYVYHGANAPLTPEIKKYPFDGVIMNYCFLGYRASSLFYSQRHRYRFIKDLDCRKIAICQDDFTNNGDLDDWLFDLGVTKIYSPIEKHLDVLYPKNWKAGKRFGVGHTAYVDSSQIQEYRRFALPFHKRTLDISTRVRRLPAYYGNYGLRKADVADKLGEHAKKAGFKVDVSTRPEDTLLGDEWLKLLGRSKFTIGSKGGSSIHDPVGEIRKACTNFTSLNPDATFSQIKSHCFKGLDNQYVFTAISPRLFEAAALDTCQILVKENYVGGLEPYEDYIPLNEDLSNVKEVFEIMGNEDLCREMTANCRKKLVDSGEFDYKNWVNEVLSEFQIKGPLTDKDQEVLSRHIGAQHHFNELRQKLGGTYVSTLKHFLLQIISHGYEELEVLHRKVSKGHKYCSSYYRLAFDGIKSSTDKSTYIRFSTLAHAANKDAWQHVVGIVSDVLHGSTSVINLYPWDMSELIHDPKAQPNEPVLESEDYAAMFARDLKEGSPVPRYVDLEYIDQGLKHPEDLPKLAQDYSDKFLTGTLPLPFRFETGKKIKRKTELPKPIQEVLKPPRKGQRSIMFIHHAYYHFYYLARALRDRGWHAVSVSTENPKSANQPYYHGQDFEFYSDDVAKYEAMQYELFDAVKQHFKMVHFHADSLFSIFAENTLQNVCRDGVPWDFLALKAHGVKIGHSISGCLTGQRQTVFNEVSDGVCNSCVWQNDLSVCSDAKNGFVGEKIMRIADLNAIEIDWPGDVSRQTPQCVQDPLVYCLDENVWSPDLKISRSIERFKREPDEMLVFHAVGNFDIRDSDTRNIKGTPAVVRAIDRLREEGHAIKLVFKTGIPSKDMRFYQLQADIVVDQLNYGRYGATARECLMLGIPTICAIDPKQPAGVRRSKALNECPLINADEKTIYDVLKDLVNNRQKLKDISKQSRAYALKWHSAAKCAERFERIYDRLMDDQLPLEAD